VPGTPRGAVPPRSHRPIGKSLNLFGFGVFPAPRGFCRFCCFCCNHLRGTTGRGRGRAQHQRGTHVTIPLLSAMLPRLPRHAGAPRLRCAPPPPRLWCYGELPIVESTACEYFTFPLFVCDGLSDSLLGLIDPRPSRPKPLSPYSAPAEYVQTDAALQPPAK